MSNINYIPSSQITPVKMEYNYYKNEPTNSILNVYKEGYSFYTTPFFENFKDFTINKGTALILTSATNLNNFFDSYNIKNTVDIPSVLILQPSNITNEYAAIYNNQIVLSSAPTIINLINNGNNTAFLTINNQYLQISDSYPYTIFLNNDITSNDNLNYRSFQYNYQQGTITFSVLTPNGYRYLNFGTDHILRATGISFTNNANITFNNNNQSNISNYTFNVMNYSENISENLYFRNDWVTYYMSLQTSNNNQNVEIDKVVNNVPTNFLVSFSIQDTADANVNLNIANLKTGYTPSMSPTMLNNL